jgi:hypothetical protein
VHILAAGFVHSLGSVVGSYWWLIFIFGGGVAASAREAVQRHHKRRLAILSAKAELRASKAGPAAPPDPQPVCGCTHHLSFHNPRTAVCAVQDCRCQQYIGPEPLGYVVPMPLVDPEKLDPPLTP